MDQNLLQTNFEFTRLAGFTVGLFLGLATEILGEFGGSGLLWGWDLEDIK